MPVDQILDGDLQELDCLRTPTLTRTGRSSLFLCQRRRSRLLKSRRRAVTHLPLLYVMNGEPDKDDNVDAIEHEAAEESAKQARYVNLRGGHLILQDLSQADAWLIAGTLSADLRPGLRALTLDGSAVHASGCEAIGHALSTCRALRVLRMNTCQLTDKARIRYQTAAYSTSRVNLLAELEAQDNDVDEDACKFIPMLYLENGLRCGPAR